MNPLYRIHDTWANLHSLWRVLIILLLLIGGLFLVFGPGRTAYRVWKSSGNLEKAEQALAESRFAEARDLSFQILRQDEDAFAPLPILLHSTTALKDPLAVRVAIAMLRNDRTLPKDHLLAWTYLCQSGPSYLPLSIWPLLTEKKKNTPDYQLPLIDRMVVDQMIPTATAIVASSPEPYSIEIHYRLLVMLAKTATEEAYKEFNRSLSIQLLTTPDSWARLLEAIDEIPQNKLSAKIYESLPETAISDTSLDTAAALRIIRCEMAANPEKSEQLTANAFERFLPSQPTKLARWCLRIGQQDAAAKCVDLEAPSEEPELYRLQIEILEATGRTEQLSSFLQSPPVGIPDWETLVRLAAVARKLGDEKLSTKSIREALKSAIDSRDPAALVLLARQAEKYELDALALDAWTNAIVRAIGPLPPSQSIPYVIKKLSDQGREDELYAVLNSFRFIEPGNQVIQTQHLYLACLSGRADPTAIIDELAPLQEKFPDKLALRCILAIAHLLSGEIQKADALTNNPEIDWFGTNPAYRAIRGIVLTKNNQIEEAKVYFDGFPWDDLLPSEKRVFESLADGELQVEIPR